MNDAIHCYCLIYDESKKTQISLGQFFKALSSIKAASSTPMTTLLLTSRASSPLLVASYSDDEESVAEDAFNEE